jgi:hypothetical protein
MRISLTIALLAILAGTTTLRAAGREAIPSNARLVKETIVNVLRLERDCKSVDNIQNSIQPLLFVLYRSTDRETGRILRDLASYYLGEANTQILRCIMIRRGETDNTFATSLAKGSSDCRSQLGQQSTLCQSSAGQSTFLALVSKSIRKRQVCELEY